MICRAIVARVVSIVLMRSCAAVGIFAVVSSNISDLNRCDLAPGFDLGRISLNLSHSSQALEPFPLLYDGQVLQFNECLP